MAFHTLALSGAGRVEAVHVEFASRSGADVLHVLTMVGVGAVVLFAILLFANHLQGQSRRRREAEHRAEMDAKLRRSGSAPLRY